MTFSGKSNNGSAPKERRSVLGTMFNPRVGESIRPIGESFTIFVNLIALVFAMNGLFPKNHPALTNEPDAPRLHLMDVIRTAWDGLSFTKQGLPKVLLFVAVIGCMVCGVLSVVTILSLVLMGKAHAQTAYFTPASTTNDVGYNIIDYLFSPTNSATGYANLNTQYGAFTGGGVLPNENIQAALWTALAAYSGAILVFAGIILFYHLVSMIVDTAHSGVVMGRRANQIWAPIRLAVAVILLVPSGAGGLNAGQLLVMQVAQWGSALGSNVWDAFVGAKANTYAAAFPPTPQVVTLVQNMAQMAACEYAYNYEVYRSALGSPDMAVYSNDSFIVGWPNGWTSGSTTPWDSTKDPQKPEWNGATGVPLIETTAAGNVVHHFTTPVSAVSDYDICGNYTVPPPPVYDDPAENAFANAIYTAHIAAFNAIIPQIMHYGTNVYLFLPDNGDPAAQGDIPVPYSGTPINVIINTYQAALNTGIMAAITAQNTAAGASTKYGSLGWVGAGAYFSRVANIQAVVHSASMSYLPKALAPKGGSTPQSKTALAYVSDFNTYLKKDLQMTDPASLAGIAIPKTVGGSGGGCAGSTNFDYTALKNTVLDVLNTGPTDMVLKIVDQIAGMTGVWCSGAGGIGVHFTGASPLAQMAQWGHSNMEQAVTLTDYGMWLCFVGALQSNAITAAISDLGAVFLTAFHSVSSFFGSGKDGDPQAKANAEKTFMPTLLLDIGLVFGAGASNIGMALLAFVPIFFTLGMLCGFILPLLPFMHFFFGTISWIALLFEAVIAMPLVALAHITPEGEGISGPQARGAYVMAFSILLRPAMMIFGLISAFLVLDLATSLLNMLFGIGMSSTGGTGTHVVLGKIIRTIMYCIILFSIANHAFQLINQIPDKVMSWFGHGHGAATSKMGDPSTIENKTLAGAAILANAGAPALGRMTGNITKGAGTYLQSGSQKAYADKENPGGYDGLSRGRTQAGSFFHSIQSQTRKDGDVSAGLQAAAGARQGMDSANLSTIARNTSGGGNQANQASGAGPSGDAQAGEAASGLGGGGGGGSSGGNTGGGSSRFDTGNVTDVEMGADGVYRVPGDTGDAPAPSGGGSPPGLPGPSGGSGGSGNA